MPSSRLRPLVPTTDAWHGETHQVVEEGALAGALRPHDGDHGVAQTGCLDARGLDKLFDTVGAKLSFGGDDLNDLSHGCVADRIPGGSQIFKLRGREETRGVHTHAGYTPGVTLCQGCPLGCRVLRLE